MDIPTAESIKDKLFGLNSKELSLIDHIAKQMETSYVFPIYVYDSTSFQNIRIEKVIKLLKEKGWSAEMAEGSFNEWGLKIDFD